MKRIAIYPGTFDPLTNGHMDLIQRSAELYDHIIVAVAKSSRKDPFLPLKVRVEWTREVLQELKNVEVEPLEGLLIEFAKRKGAQCLLRGLRAVSDFDYEFQLAGMNRRMEPNIETIFLPATEDVSYISGTMVREIFSLGGDIAPFVPTLIASKLKSDKKKWL